MSKETVKRDILGKVFKPRDKDSHKGDFGYILIVGGNECYSGAPALAGMAAYRTGCDLVTICAPKRAADIAAGFSPSIVTCPLEGSRLVPRHEEIIIKAAERFDVLLLGNGAGDESDTIELFKKLIRNLDLPMIIDADALKAVASVKEEIINKNIILTPHIKEFEILTGQSISNLNKQEKIKVVQEAASELNSVILLKGPEDIISNGRKTVINKTGSPYMSVGGTGDVLAGICAALVALNGNLFDSAQAGAYICGKAGEIVAKKIGPSLIPEDIITEIKNVH